MGKKIKIIGTTAGFLCSTAGLVAHSLRKTAESNSYSAEIMEPISARKQGFYEKYIKRCVDVACASSAIICFSPLYLGVAALVKIKLGSPILFSQDRPGIIDENGKETIFKMYKFRTMTDERDANGELLPDDVRLTKFGAWLRSTSLDELPEAFNILNGTMSVIGPRPQLIRDMTFMSKEQRRRHTAKPGLSGLAQVNGRNAISWTDKLCWDLKYVENVCLINDLRILGKTVKKAFFEHEGITQDNMATAEDYGDYLLRSGKTDQETYEKHMDEASSIRHRDNNSLSVKELTDFRFSVSMCVYKGDNPLFFEQALESIIHQSLVPNEIVITVDGPIPDSIEGVIRNYKNQLQETDVSFKTIYLERNMGHGEARRVGLNNCSFDLVALMDADDLSCETRFEQEVNAFKENKALSIVGSHVSEFFGEPTNIKSIRTVKLSDADIKKDMQIRCPMNQPTVMFRKADVMEVGGYKDWYCNEDYYLWIRLALANKQFRNIDDCLVNMRMDNGSYQRRGGLRYFKSEIAIQKLMLKKSIINPLLFSLNAGKRFIVQIAIPNSARSFIFSKFARRSVK